MCGGCHWPPACPVEAWACKASVILDDSNCSRCRFAHAPLAWQPVPWRRGASSAGVLGLLLQLRARTNGARWWMMVCCEAWHQVREALGVYVGLWWVGRAGKPLAGAPLIFALLFTPRLGTCKLSVALSPCLALAVPVEPSTSSRANGTTSAEQQRTTAPAQRQAVDTDLPALVMPRSYPTGACSSVQVSSGFVDHRCRARSAVIFRFDCPPAWPQGLCAARSTFYGEPGR